MGVFDRQTEMALRLIDKYGDNSVNFVRKALTTPDPTKPWEMITSSSTSTTVSMLFLTKYKEHSFLKYLPNTAVPTGNIVAIMGAQDFEPMINDTVETTTGNYLIENVDRVSPNNDTILWVLTLKRL